MTTVESNLETKLTQLDINVKKTNVVIESQNPEATERHLQTLKAISDTVNHLRLEIEAKKIESKVNSHAIQTWNDDVDSKLQAADSYFDDPGIRGDLVRTDPEWEKWDFVKLSEAIRLWTRRNHIRVNGETRSGIDHANSTSAWARFQPKECVYCEDVSHKPLNCQKITKIEER
ncbi:unnamed protein product, partial [Porites lobata]